MRLNRYLAQCGLGSRRAVEELIKAGRVRINGRVVERLAIHVDEQKDRVAVDEQPVGLPVRYEFIMLHKPKGYDVTRGGRHHHRRAYDLLPSGTHPSVQAVGRLDRNSTGLLLFTNDGELNFRLTHPRHGCRKVYAVDVEGAVGREVLRRLEDGVELEDGPAKVIEVEKQQTGSRGESHLRIVIAEGRKRIIRRMCEAVDHPVVRLHRTAVGPLELGDLPIGRTRPLTSREVTRLRRSVGQD